MRSLYRKRRVLRAGALLVLLLAAAVAAWEVQAPLSYDGAAWQTEYQRLRAHTEASYANLLWAAETGRVDPNALDQQAQERLGEAGTDRAARAVLTEFLQAFDDPHVRIEAPGPEAWLKAVWSALAPESGEDLDYALTGTSACVAMGFSEAGASLPFDFGEAAVAALEGESPFPAAVVTLPSGRQAGILRIDSFRPEDYAGTCARAWTIEFAHESGNCDAACQEDFTFRIVPEQLLRELAERGRSFEAAGVEVTAIDVTGNGGGSGWADAAARVVAGDHLQSPRMSVVRHPLWIEALEASRASVDTALASAHGEEETALRVAATRLDGAIEAAGEVCELSGLWEGEAPACSNLVEDAFFSSGLFGQPPPGRWEDPVLAGLLFEPAATPYEPGVFPGRVVVLTDDGTASASELFAAMIVDGGAGVTMGSRTFGVGCGHTTGAAPLELEHADLTVWMPDCQRLRADGTNELESIPPEVDLGWNGDDAAERGAKLLTALDAL